MFCTKRNEQKYCSRECARKVTLKFGRQKGRVMTEKHRQNLSNSLKGRPSNCGSFSKGHKINLGKIRLDMRGENSRKWVPPIKKLCAYCYKELFLKPNQIRNKNFCNRDCWALGTRGKGSPIFKGEEAVNRLRNRIAQFPEYKEWRMKIFKRDQFTCQMCKNKKARPIEAHHNKKRFLDIANDNNLTIENARNCKELWDTNNGETVCKSCHCTTDTYGTKGTSKKILLT